MKLSEHFSLKEFACRCGKHLTLPSQINFELIKKLENLRMMANLNKPDRPLYTTSGFRCYYYNKKIGGSPDSQHLYGKAADIYMPGVALPELLYMAYITGFRGLGLYPTWIHVDVRKDYSFFGGDRRQIAELV